MNTAAPTIPAMAVDIIVRRIRLLAVRRHMRHYRRHILAAQRHQEIGDGHLDRATEIAARFKVRA